MGRKSPPKKNNGSKVKANPVSPEINRAISHYVTASARHLDLKKLLNDHFITSSQKKQR